MAVSPVNTPSTTRRTVRSFTDYADAERTVDWLSDQGFPVEHLAIVGSGLRYIEQVSKRVTTGTATLTGAGGGAMLGLFWGLLFALFFTVDNASFLGLVGYGVVLGALLGAAFGAITHGAQRGRRDFDSVAQTRADRYEVVVDDSYADEVERLLGRMPTR
jgi:hypothetical protein